MARQPPGDDREDALHQAARRTVELIYFIHIEQASRADALLEEFELGRPHHRVLYFADARPGISVGELMAILRISNQALGRTISQLVALELVEQRYSLKDRRIRQHFLTQKGKALLDRLTATQHSKILPALRKMEPAVLLDMWQGLEAMCRSADRKWITPAPSLGGEATGGVESPWGGSEGLARFAGEVCDNEQEQKVRRKS